jgi:hypothetical protein
MEMAAQIKIGSFVGNQNSTAQIVAKHFTDSHFRIQNVS